ncbi:MAG TPA: ribokinase [Puia sp.]|jgi:ribokinase
MNQIFIVGSSNTDMVVKTKDLPLPGETKLGGEFFMNAGGKGANQAVAAARLEGHVTLVTKLGNDIFGERTREGFKKENIDTSYIFSDEHNPSGIALIIVNAEGENTIVVAPGANGNLLPADIEKVKNIGDASVILMQLEIPLETIGYTAKLAKSNQQMLIINPAPAQKLHDELLNGLFLITPNETEAYLLTGIKVRDESTASEAASVLLSKGLQNVIITMGRDGAFFQNKNLKFKLDAPVVKAIDTTAAGDVFNGALSVALTENMEWESAIQFAIHAASLSVTKMGAQSSVPYRNEIILPHPRY